MSLKEGVEMLMGVWKLQGKIHC